MYLNNLNAEFSNESYFAKKSVVTLRNLTEHAQNGGQTFVKQAFLFSKFRTNLTIFFENEKIPSKWIKIIEKRIRWLKKVIFYTFLAIQMYFETFEIAEFS